MAKNYFKTSIETPNDLKPKEETINFILNYSKALSVIKSDKVKFELVLN
ncbi:hypothetical protein [Confluentibacter lentus]|nr:hypothetical protein [Confluentibacter lentus]